jgi:regulator of RNase E activity RraA
MTQIQTLDNDLDDLLRRFAPIPAANVGDAMDRLGALIGIHSVWPGARLIGPAFTVWTRAGDNVIIHAAIDKAPAGSVLVINGEGDVTRALLGEMMGAKAKRKGIAGFVVDGMVRDAGGLQELGMPVFARGVTPAGPYKNGPGRLGEPVAVGNVAVSPGDIVLGDDDGVVIIPANRAASIILGAEKIFEKEAGKRSDLF